MDPILHLFLFRRRRVDWLYVPNRVGVLLDTAITAKKSHPAHAHNRLGHPFAVVLVRLVHQRMRFDIAIEVITDQIVISVVDDGVDQRCEAVGVTKTPGLDSFENLDQIWVKGKRAVSMGVT